jgi:hypothetical protein
MTARGVRADAERQAPWRRSRLRRAGFDEGAAARIADEPGFDVEALVALVERGCPPALAERILRPLEPTA